MVQIAMLIETCLVGKGVVYKSIVEIVAFGM
jgi:hypothetical protein